MRVLNPEPQASCHYIVVDVNVHARLTQTYVSTANVAQDVKYIFPLPSNAAVCAFNAVIDDKRTIHGIVKQKDEAKRDYEKAVSEGKTAGLLDQHTADGECRFEHCILQCAHGSGQYSRFRSVT